MFQQGKSRVFFRELIERNKTAVSRIGGDVKGIQLKVSLPGAELEFSSISPTSEVWMCCSFPSFPVGVFFTNNKSLKIGRFSFSTKKITTRIWDKTMMKLSDRTAKWSKTQEINIQHFKKYRENGIYASNGDDFLKKSFTPKKLPVRYDLLH